MMYSVSCIKGDLTLNTKVDRKVGPTYNKRNLDQTKEMRLSRKREAAHTISRKFMKASLSTVALMCTFREVTGANKWETTKEERRWKHFKSHLLEGHGVGMMKLYYNYWAPRERDLDRLKVKCFTGESTEKLLKDYNEYIGGKRFDEKKDKWVESDRPGLTEKLERCENLESNDVTNELKRILEEELELAKDHFQFLTQVCQQYWKPQQDFLLWRKNLNIQIEYPAILKTTIDFCYIMPEENPCVYSLQHTWHKFENPEDSWLREKYAEFIEVPVEDIKIYKKKGSYKLRFNVRMDPLKAPKIVQSSKNLRAEDLQGWFDFKFDPERCKFKYDLSTYDDVTEVTWDTAFEPLKNSHDPYPQTKEQISEQAKLKSLKAAARVVNGNVNVTPKESSDSSEESTFPWYRYKPTWGEALGIGSAATALAAYFWLNTADNSGGGTTETSTLAHYGTAAVAVITVISATVWGFFNGKASKGATRPNTISKSAESPQSTRDMNTGIDNEDSDAPPLVIGCLVLLAVVAICLFCCQKSYPDSENVDDMRRLEEGYGS